MEEKAALEVRVSPHDFRSRQNLQAVALIEELACRDRYSILGFR